jgi:hypothetical protein
LNLGFRQHQHHLHHSAPGSAGGGFDASFGSSSSSAKPLGLRAHALSSTSVRIEWNKPAKQPFADKTEYSLSYMAEDSAEENFLTTYDAFYVLRNLRPYTTYTVWVGTTTAAGGGARGATDDVTVRTYSDVPSEAPQNFTAEAASAKVSIFSEDLAQKLLRDVEQVIQLVPRQIVLSNWGQSISQIIR